MSRRSGVPFSATEGKGETEDPGLNPPTTSVCLLGDPIPGEPSLSELPLDMRWGTTLLSLGDP